MEARELLVFLQTSQPTVILDGGDLDTVHALFLEFGRWQSLSFKEMCLRSKLDASQQAVEA